MSRQARHDWFFSFPQSASKRKKRCIGRRLNERRSLRLEPLEDRRLLSITVNTLVDENDGIGIGGTSLRDALAAATPGETINFAVTGTILLEHGELLINKSLTIAGPGARELSVDAGGASRVFNVDNAAAGLANVNVYDLTITGGITGGDGGGILNRENLEVYRVEIVGNEADDGGGIANFGGTFSILDSTISNNQASNWGGGIFNFSANKAVTSTITNSTVSTNSAAVRGGGVNNFLGTINIAHSTITHNGAPVDEGSGVSSWADTNTTLTTVYSSIIAGNVHTDVDLFPGTFPPTFQSLGYNLIGTGDAAQFFVAAGDARNVANPRLGPLADNGGPTRTHALLVSSPAIDTGQPTFFTPPDYDQRGLPHPRVADGNGDAISVIDKGAFETYTEYLLVDMLADEFDGNHGPGDLSLREALSIANGNTNWTVIDFDPALFAGGPAILELSNGLGGELVIASDTTLRGPGSELLTIDAQDNFRVFRVDDGFDLAGARVDISGLTLTNGFDTGGGGGIRNHERLTARDTVISGNQAQWGAGIYNHFAGELTVEDSTISGNSIVSLDPEAPGSGGGIYNWGGLANVKSSTIEGNSAPDAAGIKNVNNGFLVLSDSLVIANIAANSGGGVRNDGGEVYILGSTVSGNTAGTGGGGVVNCAATTHITESSIANNSALQGGGVWNILDGDLNINRTTISGNMAAGSGEIFNSGGGVRSEGGTVSIANSTLSGNSADYGGGVYVDAPIVDTLTIDSSTISSNVAPFGGAGIYNFHGRLVVQYSTVTENNSNDFSGSGITSWEDTVNTLTELHSSIVAGNYHTDLAADGFVNTIYSQGYNLIGVFGYSETFAWVGDQVIGNADPLLGPLADNGGPTWTHALLPGSPAIDTGDPSAVAGSDGVPEFDQRGVGFDRVRDGNAAEGIAIDKGAFEVQQFIAGPALPGDYNLDDTVDAADYTLWRDTLGASVTPFAGADGDGDGNIDQDDYQVWVDNFGESLPGSGGAAQVEALAGAAAIDGLIVVTTIDDETDIANGLTSLREAIFAANLVGGPNTIQFAESLYAAGPATILLTLGELLITDAVTIDGPGAELLTIDASGNDSNLETLGNGTRIFQVNDSLSNTSLEFHIDGLTLTGGDVADSGGAILSRENLYAVNLQIVGNSAGAGGAITLSGYTASSTVIDCFIANNHATVDGGAILLQATGPGATSFIVGNTITGNSARRGGAIFVGLSAPGAVLDFFDNEITNNTSEFQGGAIYVLSQSTPKTTIRSSTISGNTAGTKGGGIYVNLARDLSIIDSTISGNRTRSEIREQGRGGGIYSASGELSIVGSTISGNMGTSGGGIFSRNGDLAISFSTIADNSVTSGDGGGIYSFQDRLSIVGSTISGNTAFDSGSLGGQILGRGGGLAHTAGPVTPTTILDTNFIANTSNTSGGGAFFRSNSDGGNASISLTNTSFSTNSSKVGGGVMLGDGGNFFGTLVMDDGVISGNHATTHGGGVYGVAYSVLVNGTTITGNRAEGNGGGWSAFGAAGRSGVRNLSFVGAHITENSAGGSDSPTNSGLGGGIHIPLGFVFMSLFDSEVSRNSARDGGGIARGGPVVASGLLSVKDSTISGNSAFRHGGGIYNVGGSISVTRSTIANNRSTPVPGAAFGNGGGIFARQSDVSLVESTLSGNSVANGRGGGLYLGQTGDLTVTASTIVGNSANQDGGGVWDGASQERVLIQSSTVSGNSSAAGTGGLYLRGHLSIRNSTVTKNVGGGTRPGGALAGDGAQQLELDHSIVAGNLHKSFGPPDLLFFTNASNITVRSSLIGDNTQSKLVEAPLGSPDANGNLIGQPISAGGQGAIDPVLGPLAPNGGRTLTHSLLPGSPALDAGAVVTGPSQGYDQRGNPFQRMVDGTGDRVVRIDMGAYESQGVPMFTVGDFSRDGLVDACDFVIYRDELGKHVEPFSQADADGNGVVDVNDYELWKANFGKGLTFNPGAGGLSSFALVDEPAAEMLTIPGGPVATTGPVTARLRPFAVHFGSVSTARSQDNALLAYLASRGKLASDGNALSDAILLDEDVDESTEFDLALDAAFSTL